MEDNQINQPKRPTFLTILCILTFIGSAYSIFSGASSVMLASTSAAMLKPIQSEVDKEFDKALESIKEEKKEEAIEELNEQMALDSLSGDSVLTSNEIEKAIESEGGELGEKMIGNIQNTVGDMLNNVTEDNIRNNGYATIIAAILTLLGAFFMWGLKKMGFMLYVIGVAISIIAPIAIFNGNILVALTSIGIGFFGLLFIILYALNRKYLVY
jgi:hypothetical protein